jgi:hypothetical protein
LRPSGCTAGQRQRTLVVTRSVFSSDVMGLPYARLAEVTTVTAPVDPAPSAAY